MKKAITITPELRIILACAETIEIEVDESSELAEAKDHIAQQQERINAMLEQRNRMGQDVQSAAITGRVPELHPIGAQLGLVANLRTRVTELERQAAIGRRAVEMLADTAEKVESLVGWVGRNMSCGCTPLELVRARALIKIMREYLGGIDK